MYRDVTPLLAIDEDFARPASVDAAVTTIRRGNLAVVSSADDAVAALVKLGSSKRHATFIVGEAAADGDFAHQPSTHFRMHPTDEELRRPRSFRVPGDEFKYNPNQPRVPAGQSGGGRWTSGGSSALTGDEQWIRDLAKGTGDEVPFDQLMEGVEGWDPARAAEIAKDQHATATRMEPTVTARLQELAGDPDFEDYHEPQSGEGELFGAQYRFKVEEKIAQKIGRKMVEKNLTFDEAAASLNDSLRYTIHFTEDEFGEAAQAVIDGLRADNAKPGLSPEEVVRVKNTWPPEKGKAYKGVNAVVTTPEGFKYEVQFHTPQSQAVKDRMHILYEAQRVLPKSDPRWQQLEDLMQSVGNGQPTPRDAVNVYRVARSATMKVEVEP